MKKILWIAVVAIGLCLSMAASRSHTITPSGKQVTETRSTAQFNEISVSTGITVYLQQGSDQKVVVRTDQNAKNYVVTEVRGGALKVHYAENVKVRRIKTEVYVTAREIEKLTVSSGADIEIKGTLKGDALVLTASSAGDIEGQIDYDSVSASASSGGDIELSGTANQAKASASSGSDIDFGKLKAKVVLASASSGADIEVWATQTLTASASSGADISYRGNPKDININRSSGGSVGRDN